MYTEFEIITNEFQTILNWNLFELSIAKVRRVWYNKIHKYEQSVNRTKKGRKKLIVRIFCELRVKTGSGSRINTGFPDPTVEME